MTDPYAISTVGIIGARADGTVIAGFMDPDHPQADAEFTWARDDLIAAWPHLYAAALHDFADRMDKALETVGAGEDPATAYRYVVACARSLADEATP